MRKKLDKKKIQRKTFVSKVSRIILSVVIPVILITVSINISPVLAIEDINSILIATRTISTVNDDIAPPRPIITVSPLGYIPTKYTIVTLSIEKDNEGGSGLDKTEYRINNGRWIEYFSPFRVDKNSIIEARNSDKAGNISYINKIEIENIDNELPTLILNSSNLYNTNKDITITAEATDNVRISKIILPDNTEIRSEYPTGVEKLTAEFLVSKNGTYSFKTIDTAGNEKIESIVVSNINKINPIITIKDYTKYWTNKDIVVSAITDKGSLNQTSFTFKNNGSFTFIATDKYGNISKKEIKISNIDKTPPTIQIK